MKKLLMTASSWGHIQQFHLPYLRKFKACGWQVHVGCANPPETSPEADVLIDLPFTKKMTSIQNFEVSHQLRKCVKKESYDLIICHTSLAAFFTRLAVKGLSHRPRVINMVHGYLFDDETSTVKKAIYWGAEKLTAPVTDVVLTMNQWDKNFACKHKLGAEIDFVNGVGVDFSTLEIETFNGIQRSQLGIPEDAFVMIYPAEFSSRKNQKMLIEAMVQLPKSVYLLLPGRGELLEECKELARFLNVANRIEFPGYVDQIPQWYAVADMAVSASRSEGLPFNIMEAMACGLYVVASDVKGHQDLITTSNIGQLYSYNDTTAFVDAILRCLKVPQQLASGGGLRREAVNRYDLCFVEDQVLAAYGIAVPVVAY